VQKLKQQEGLDVIPQESEKQLWEVCAPENCSAEASTGPQSSTDGVYETNSLKPVPVRDSESGTVSIGHNANIPRTAANKGSSKKQVLQTEGRKESEKKTAPDSSGGERSSGKTHVGKTAQPSNVKRPSSLDNAHKLQSANRPGSAQGKVRPAHVNAPFKTDPNLRVPKRSNTKMRPLSAQRKGHPPHIHSSRGDSAVSVLPPINRNMNSCSPDTSTERSNSARTGSDCDTYNTNRTIFDANKFEMPKSAVAVDERSVGETTGASGTVCEDLTQLKLTGKAEKTEKQVHRGAPDVRTAALVEEGKQNQDEKTFNLITDGYVRVRVIHKGHCYITNKIKLIWMPLNEEHFSHLLLDIIHTTWASEVYLSISPHDYKEIMERYACSSGIP
jgi:hypothetical protein